MPGPLDALKKWALGTEEPQPYREPTIGADPTFGPTRWLQEKVHEYGLDPERYKDPSTQPPIRVLGALRDMVSNTLGTPAGQAAQAVSMFMKPGGGGEAARQLSLERFRREANILPKNLRESNLRLAETHPRVAAHQAIELGGNPPSGETAAYAIMPREGVRRPVRITYTPTAIAETTGWAPLSEGKTPQMRAGELPYHEGIHTAQVLGNPEMAKLYGLANRAVGYRVNPAEVSARKGGLEAGAGIPAGGHAPTLEGLKQISESSWPNPGAQQAADEIGMILARRANAPVKGPRTVDPSRLMETYEQYLQRKGK